MVFCDVMDVFLLLLGIFCIVVRGKGSPSFAILGWVTPILVLKRMHWLSGRWVGMILRRMYWLGGWMVGMVLQRMDWLGGWIVGFVKEGWMVGLMEMLRYLQGCITRNVC